jgi:hypothetical protein
MNDLETALKNHDWSHAGYLMRPALDKLMKENPDTGQALWEQHCPWSDAKGGYIEWAKNKKI